MARRNTANIEMIKDFAELKNRGINVFIMTTTDHATGEKSYFRYDTEDEAEQAGRRMRMACGMQVAWWGVRRAD